MSATSAHRHINPYERSRRPSRRQRDGLIVGKVLIEVPTRRPPRTSPTIERSQREPGSPITHKRPDIERGPAEPSVSEGTPQTRRLGMRRALGEQRVMGRSARDDDRVMEWTNERTIERRSRASVLVCGPLCKALARAGGYRGRPPRPTSLGPENVPFPEDLDCAARMA